MPRKTEKKRKVMETPVSALSKPPTKRRKVDSTPTPSSTGQGDDGGSNSSALSSISRSESPDEPLQVIVNGQVASSNKRVSANQSSKKMASADTMAAGKTSQKGAAMGRTMIPTAAGTLDGTTLGAAIPPPLPVQTRLEPPSSPEMALSKNGLPSPPPIEETIRVKREEFEPTLSQVASGQPVDTEDFVPDVQPKERAAIVEERNRVIAFHVVSSSQPSPASLIVLTGLKNIFQKQLPKMPREYIARLVFDRNHWSMAIVKRGLQVVGGITYRPFEARGFAEIVFCAITGTEQVKGYGSHLMNHLKDHVRIAHPTVQHFLTYADNYAVGYFKKQGFTKEITLDRSRWAGYIKDYEGGTIMQCTMLPRITYLDVRNLLKLQKEAILSKIRQVSRSHIVHRGRDIFPPGVETVDPSQVPGLKDLGWTPQMDELYVTLPVRAPQHNIMQRLLTDMQNHASSWAFARPVNKDEVADYYEVVKYPMDLETMEYKLDANQYTSLEAFLADAKWIFDNCRGYNAESSNYVKNANKLEAYLKERLDVYTGD